MLKPILRKSFDDLMSMVKSREYIRGSSHEIREFLTSPRQVLRHLMLLLDGRQYCEAAAMVGRLSSLVLRSVIADLPIDLLLDNLPHSMYLLESLFTRPDISVEELVWQLVRLFTNTQDVGLRHCCSKLSQVVARYDPSVRQLLRERRHSFHEAVQSLGMHGLSANMEGQLISLHSALKEELQRHMETYKAAIQKLDELSLITVNQDPAHSSHQRLLAINYGDIQQRLIDNKTLQTLIDKPALKQLPSLLATLSLRVENDKEVLKCVSQLKPFGAQAGLEKRPVAGLLMNFARGCETLLHLLDKCDTQITHSTLSSSPTLGATITENTLNIGNGECRHSAVIYDIGSSCSDGYHSDDSATTIGADNNSKMVSLFRCLYVQKRTDTLEALDSMEQLKHVHNLKIKIIFSIVVLSFRLCHEMRERKVLEVRHTLNCPLDSSNEMTLTLDRSVRLHLSGTVDIFPLGEIERSVFNQVLSTLHEYPCLQSCLQLTYFVRDCVRLAWQMVNQEAPYYIDSDFNLGFLSPEKHVRHPQADSRSDLIKIFLWPALMQNSSCILKAVVVT